MSYTEDLKDLRFKEFCDIILSLNPELHNRVIKDGIPSVVYCNPSVVDAVKELLGRFIAVCERPIIDVSTLLFHWETSKSDGKKMILQIMDLISVDQELNDHLIYYCTSFIPF